MPPSTRPLSLVSLLSLSLSVRAHMEMSWPYAFRSKFNPQNTDPDYSNTSPLDANGANYPCKGYQDLAGSQAPVVTYTPGQTYNMTVAGSATHGGGSCQISLSYDDGRTFHVIKSMIGGCPLKSDWDFTVPAYAPASENAILAWTWFNLIGNREMYMNCARVRVTGSQTQRVRRRGLARRQSSISELPDVFACDIGNGCTTLEDHQIVFPSPGNVVEYGNDSYAEGPGPGYVESGSVPGSSSGSSTVSSTGTTTGTPSGANFMTVSGTSPSLTTTTTTTTGANTAPITTTTTSTWTFTTTSSTGPRYPFDNATTIYPGNGTGTGTGILTGYIPLITGSSNTTSLLTSNSSTITTAAMTNSTTTESPPPPPTTTTMTTTTMTTTTTMMIMTTTTIASTTSTQPTPTFVASSCAPGTFACNSTSSFSQCVADVPSGTSYIYMGAVAAGMQCVDGQIIRQNEGACTPSGSLQCQGSQAFYLCTNGGLISMGPVAAGTMCVNGQIVAA